MSTAAATENSSQFRQLAANGLPPGTVAEKKKGATQKTDSESALPKSVCTVTGKYEKRNKMTHCTARLTTRESREMLFPRSKSILLSSSTSFRGLSTLLS